MTLPNKLTLIRIFLIPVMIIIFYIPWFSNNFVPVLGMSWLYLIEFVIFAVASITDFFDGHIARSRNLVTTFGKFADPLADKMLVFSAMAILMVSARTDLVTGSVMPMWAFVIMIIREFMVSGIRMLVASRGVVIPAGKLGKFKTFTTMVAICVLFFSQTHIVIAYAGQILMYVACLFTVISGAEYFWQSRKVIFESI
jgi:CDP-diacylglycerol--glycerol-3-phosphate 3-phosphatidyltransferase